MNIENETIGKVVLDYANYPGEDYYSDGAVEDQMLQIAKKLCDTNYKSIIESSKNWPILYHFSRERENILEWYSIDKTSSVLEIGAGCGAVTGVIARKANSVTCVELSRKRSLINAWRHKELDNVKILVGNFQDIEKTSLATYDYVTLIGVFEYAQAYLESNTPYKDMLKLINEHLNPNGKILIAIENRLGLKYWAGCKEDHYGEYFVGLENYIDNYQGIKTFSKKELERLFRESGNYNAKFYYPYPDYKLPSAIYSDEYLPRKGELYSNLRNFDQSRMVLFDEEKVYNSLVEGELFPIFSNSFFVELERKN